MGGCRWYERRANEILHLGPWQTRLLLAVHHTGGLPLRCFGHHNFARAYEQEGMLAYVRDIQREERAAQVPQLTHQKWSGAEYIDALQSLINTNNSTGIMSTGVTETQFSAPAK